MRDDIYELVSCAKETGLHPTLITNATLLSTEAAQWLKKAGIQLLAISIHGADAKSHDDFCGIEGSWERAMAGIRNAATARIPFQINTSITHHNPAQFDDIVNLAKDLGAIAIESFSFAPVGDFVAGASHEKHEVGVFDVQCAPEICALAQSVELLACQDGVAAGCTGWA